ncbi:hypothetical protein Tco_0733347, partial [Tanacetum coccineum]
LNFGVVLAELNCLVSTCLWPTKHENDVVNGTPQVHTWRTLRLSSDVRVSLILGFPSISLVTVGGRSGSLVGQGSTYNRICGRECSSAASVCPRMLSGAAEKILTCVFEISGAWPFITSIKCVLTQEHLDAICAKYFVPEEVHPQLPSSDATMHERPAGKVGMYTRFFDYANYLMDLNAFIRTADPRKVRVVERPRAENERPIVTVAKHRTVTLLPTSVVRSSGELSASVEIDEHRAWLPVASHPPKRLRANYGTAGGSVTGGKSLSALNRLLQDSRLTVEQGVPALPTLPFITSSVTASPLEEGGDRTDSVTGPSLRTIGYAAQVRLRLLLLLYHGRSGSGFDAGSIRAEETVGAGSEEIYVPEWTVTKGFEMNDGRLCANMIDHFTPPAFFKTVRGMEHEQLFTEFNVSAARNLSLSSEAKDKEIEDLKSQLLKAKEESAEVTQLRAQVSGLEATENSLRGEVASAKDHNVLLEQECNSLKLKVTGLESTIAEKDHELSDLGASSSSLKSQNQSLVDQVHELEISSTDLREKLEMYEGSLKQLEEFQDNLMGPLRTRLAEIDADFTRCCMRFQESFHPHLLNVVAGRRWLLTHGMKLLVVKCLNSNEYMEALGHAFGRAIEKGMQEGLAAGIEHGQAGRSLTDLEAYIPSAEDDFNSAIRDLRDLDFPLLKELSDKKDASTWDIMDLLRLDDTVAETLGMTDLQPDVNQLMVPVHHKQDRVVIGSQALSVALDICRGRVEKMERNLVERLPFLKDVFVSIEGATWSWVRVPRKAPLVSTKFVSGLVASKSFVGSGLQMTWILDLVLEQEK